MKKKIFIIIALFVMLFSISACGGNNEGSNENKNITAFTYDNEDTSTLAKAKTTKIRFHYARNDELPDFSNYENWQMWIWDSANGQGGAWYKFDKYDDFGIFMDVEINKVSGNKETNQLGFLVVKGEWVRKDIENDRYADIDAESNGGIQHIYLRQGLEKVYYSLKSANTNSIKYARLINNKTIRLVFNIVDKDFTPNPTNLKIYVNNQDLNDYSLSEYDASSKLISINLKNNLDLSNAIKVEYKFSEDVIDSANLLITNYFDSEEFINNYTYTGNDLGVSFDNENAPTKTTFKVWAPTSQSMTLNIYQSGNYLTDKTPLHTYQMTKGEKGVWQYTVNEDLSNNYYYTYTVTNVRGTNEVVDPYAKSAGLNGRRGMVVNFTKLNQTIENWADDVVPSYGDLSDAIIYEIHVRDMTINPNSNVSEENRGKFLGLTEKGTTFTKDGVTVSTGLDHLKELGITHVQIQPSYDYSSVDESLDTTKMSEDNYNWGYDPLNYNCLEGSYSSNPSDGLSRIVEFKKMIMALHDYNIGVNMDVVYNHTSSLDTSNFEMLVPYYYHRFEANGQAYNGSGCGNEMASERAMVRKFMRESCKFWMEEYHISGFRFDLMGLMDNQTMIDIYNDSKAIYDKALVYGEPWTGGTTKLEGGNDASNLSNQKTVQSSLAQKYFYKDGAYVGAFNDVIRNAVRGDNNPGKGFVQGEVVQATYIIPGMKGLFNNNEILAPGQVLNYVSCHDNYTLYDQLVQTKGDRNLDLMYSQAEFIVFTSQGVAFMQEGEDFMRTKAYQKDGKTLYEGNSYNVGDFINSMDYELKAKNIKMFNFFKDLIAMRKEMDVFTLSTREEIDSKVKSVNFEQGGLKMVIEDGNDEYIVIHSANSVFINLTGEYEVILANFEVSDTLTGNVNIGQNQSIVLKKK